MKNYIFGSAAILVAISLANIPADSVARGFGGFHGGGGFGGGGFGGYHGGGFSGGSFDRGSFGGYGGGSFDRSSFGGGGYDRSSYGGFSSAGGYHASGFADSGYHAGGYSAGGYRAGGYSAGGYGGSLNRGDLNSFLGLPTDGGMHAAGGAYGGGFAAGAQGAAAWRGGASAHAYEGAGGTTVAHASAGMQGAAITPYGAAAGGRYAGATAVRGPEGNTYVHTSSAGRGIVAGPNGAAAGRYDTGRTSINGTTVAGHASAAYGYGTHAWSPTYCHAQAVAGRGWFGTTGIYGGAWCDAHPWAWHPAAWTAAAWTAAAWNTANWSDAAAWLDTAPQYYGYNYGNDITYQDGQVYYGSQLAGTTQQYYQEAATLANSGSAAQTSDDAQWLTLGVFGLMPEGQKTPTMVFQLAVNKQGAIRGNYFDQVTQTNLPVTGQVDKKNQRVAWSVGSGQGIIVDTGLYNLTQEESTALVHFGPDKTEQDLLVRVKQPSADENASE